MKNKNYEIIDDRLKPLPDLKLPEVPFATLWVVVETGALCDYHHE